MSDEQTVQSVNPDEPALTAEVAAAPSGESVSQSAPSSVGSEPSGAISAVPTAPPEPAAPASADYHSPNVVLDAVALMPATASAAPASEPATSSPIVASSGEPPLHEIVAEHLESIYQLTKGRSADAVTESAGLKAHIADVLHAIHNGIGIAEGELVRKLENLHGLL